MSTTNEPGVNRHPKGLYVLFATEMWERFSFYTMIAMFALYMRDTTGQGFAWSVDDTQALFSNYLMFVYASPLVGGWIADKKIGYRKAVMIGGLFFMAGHLLLSVRSIGVVYAALTCLVIGNGFFKPNVSAMVGNLYSEGSHLKDRAYNIFYMGINVGAFLAPVVAEFMKSRFGYHPAFAVAVGGMGLSVFILWKWKKYIEAADNAASRGGKADTAAVAEKLNISRSLRFTLGLVACGFSVGGLVGYLLRPQQDIEGVVNAVTNTHVFFGSSINYTLAGGVIGAVVGGLVGYFASGMSSIKASVEQAKSATLAADTAAVTVDAPPQVASHQEAANANRRAAIDAIPDWKRIGALLVIFLIVIVFWMVFHQNGTTITYWGNENTNWKVTGIISNAINPAWVIILTFPVIMFWRWLDKKGLEPSTPTKMVFGMVLTAGAFLVFFIAAKIGEASLPPGANPYALGVYKMSPVWLLGAYGVLTAGELMLSPMGLSLVSKVAPIRMRGVMMGGWFVATAIGNKLTQIGQLWDDWLHSTFWIFCSACALVMAFVLLLLLRPLKKAMPGI